MALRIRPRGREPSVLLRMLTKDWLCQPFVSIRKSLILSQAGSMRCVVLALVLAGFLAWNPASEWVASAESPDGPGREPRLDVGTRRLASDVNHGRWVWQNPLPQGNTLNSVMFVDSQTGWALGEYGTVLKTRDGGASWRSQPTGGIDALTSGSFVDSQTGWVATRQGAVLRTTDGGDTWARQASDTNRRFDSIFFLDSQNGWALSWNGWDRILLKTTNGGESWASVALPSPQVSMITFVDPRTGALAGFVLP